jgi:hypothetical protein
MAANLRGKEFEMKKLVEKAMIKKSFIPIYSVVKKPDHNGMIFFFFFF